MPEFRSQESEVEYLEWLTGWTRLRSRRQQAAWRPLRGGPPYLLWPRIPNPESESGTVEIELVIRTRKDNVMLCALENSAFFTPEFPTSDS